MQWDIKLKQYSVRFHQPLHLQEDNLPNVDKPEPIHIPSIQERAETLVSRFKGKPDRKDKPQVEQFKRKQHAFNLWMILDNIRQLWSRAP